MRYYLVAVLTATILSGAARADEAEPPGSAKSAPSKEATQLYGLPAIGKGAFPASEDKPDRGILDFGRLVVCYPDVGQEDVPISFSGVGELPDPIPLAKGQIAGYPITITFSPQYKVRLKKHRLVDADGKPVEVWVSSPESPANPDYAVYQANSIGLIPKGPLSPGSKYTVEVSADIEGQDWHAQWTFVTAKRRISRANAKKDEVPQVILAALNEHRAAAGLSKVSLDDAFGKRCELHALYLASNRNRPEIAGLNGHNEDPSLPGYTEDGQMAGMRSVISFLREGPTTSVDELMGTFYHRFPMLHPKLQRIGFGMAQTKDGLWVVVIDVGSGLNHMSKKQSD